MSVGSVLSNSNIEVLNKLIEVTEVKQQLNAQNMANWLVPGAKEVGLSKDFQTQFAAMLERWDHEGIKDLEVTTELSGKPISYEKVMGDTKRNSVDHQFLNTVLSSNFKQIETAITGRT